jgi:EAL domain-containing protein (putative c-di-GMP-specific phosphodiesterase class I)
VVATTKAILGVPAWPSPESSPHAARPVKIDGRFVRGIHEHTADEAIVTAILQLAQALDLTVVAEGVENAAVLAMLESMGCHQAQGYHISRPLQPAELVAWAMDGVSLSSGRPKVSFLG